MKAPERLSPISVSGEQTVFLFLIYSCTAIITPDKRFEVLMRKPILKRKRLPQWALGDCLTDN